MRIRLRALLLSLHIVTLYSYLQVNSRSKCELRVASSRTRKYKMLIPLGFRQNVLSLHLSAPAGTVVDQSNVKAAPLASGARIG